MDSVGAHEAKKRRLPPWMMGAAGSSEVREENKNDKGGTINHGAVGYEVGQPKMKTRSRKIVKKSLDDDKGMSISEEVCVPKRKTRSRKVVNRSLDEGEEAHDSEEVYAPRSKGGSKRIQKGTLNEDEEANADSSFALVKCDTVKRNRKNSSEVANSDANNVGTEQFIPISAPQKKRKGHINKLTPLEVSSSGTDSGRELLMEDLISIAEEYVKTDSHTEQQLQTVQACGSEEKLSAANASLDEPASSFDVPRTEHLSAASEVKSTSLTSSEQVENKSIVSNINTTGDVAQDMLNLLLGPLLMKPAEESKKILNDDDMLFDRPVQNQSQRHIMEGSTLTMKKKTSLKDKVAMLLE